MRVNHVHYPDQNDNGTADDPINPGQDGILDRMQRRDDGVETIEIINSLIGIPRKFKQSENGAPDIENTLLERMVKINKQMKWSSSCFNKSPIKS